MEAWVGYLKLPAPFDGVIVARNANTFDFVLPSTGDPTAMERSPHLAPGGSAAPIYVVDRLDIVRIFVDIPEQDANYVQIGTKATVVAKAYREQPIPGSVTRTSWALNVKSRTLRAEIDLPNPNSQLLPGMYAYAKVIIDRPNVRALPLAALTYSGEKTYCWQNQDGKAIRTEVQTGVSDGKYIEITGLQQSPTPVGADPWGPVDGSEQVIMGDLSILADGGPIEVLPAQTEEKVADEAPVKARPANPHQSARRSGNRLITPGRYSATRSCRDCRQKRPASIRPAHRGDSLGYNRHRPGRQFCPGDFSRNLGKPPRGLTGGHSHEQASSWRRSPLSAVQARSTVIDSRCPSAAMIEAGLSRSGASILNQCRHQVRAQSLSCTKTNFLSRIRIRLSHCHSAVMIFSGTSCGHT